MERAHWKTHTDALPKQTKGLNAAHVKHEQD